MTKYTRKPITAFGSPGSKHKKRGMPSQDIAAVYSDDKFSIAVVCDGCSSCSASRKGAATVSYSAMNYARNFLKPHDFQNNTQNFAIELLGAIRYSLERMASIQNIPVYELASTMLFVAVYQNHYISIQLGDGCIMIQNKKGKK